MPTDEVGWIGRAFAIDVRGHFAINGVADRHALVEMRDDADGYSQQRGQRRNRRSGAGALEVGAAVASASNRMTLPPAL